MASSGKDKDIPEDRITAGIGSPVPSCEAPVVVVEYRLYKRRFAGVVGFVGFTFLLCMIQS